MNFNYFLMDIPLQETGMERPRNNNKKSDAKEGRNVFFKVISVVSNGMPYG